MKKALAVLALVTCSAIAFATEVFQAEKLVLNATATRVDLNTQFRKGVELQNNGPNAIDCVVTPGTAAPTVTLTKARRIPAGADWSMVLATGNSIWCKAVTADQVTGAATIVTEVR